MTGYSIEAATRVIAVVATLLGLSAVPAFADKDVLGQFGGRCGNCRFWENRLVLPTPTRRS